MVGGLIAILETLNMDAGVVAAVISKTYRVEAIQIHEPIDAIQVTEPIDAIEVL